MAKKKVGKRGKVKLVRGAHHSFHGHMKVSRPHRGPHKRGGKGRHKR